MSQQSTLKMMLPYYEKWMMRFPTLSSLASAKEEEVLRLWQGLGYYSRARNLLKAAQYLIKCESFPSTVEELQSVKGIGPYTAAAIASMAFERAVIPVDGNVIRVLSRVFMIPNALNDRGDLKALYEIVSRLAPLVPLGKRGAMAQALMDLGATICRPGALAQCEACPLKGLCRAFGSEQTSRGLKSELAKERVAVIPLKKSRPKIHKISRLLLLYRDSKGAPLLRKRPRHLSLGGQWEFPFLDLESCDDWVRDHLGLHFEVSKGFRHVIMNSSYTVWLLEAGTMKKADKEHVFYSKAFSGSHTLTTMTQKALFVLEKRL
jgi:A/G-specific adenine glycosylase